MDNYGRIGRNVAENLEPEDDYGRLWTIGSALQNRKYSAFLQEIGFVGALVASRR
jgi:hypothetical protein